MGSSRDGEDRARDSDCSGGKREAGGRGGYEVGMAVRLWGLEAAESSASRSHRRPE